MTALAKARRSLSQTEVALALGIARPRISEWERGKYKPCKAAQQLILILADVLGSWQARGWPVDELKHILRTEGILGALQALN
jgi:transcriptional regulator with XRE-family HTH domain